MGLGPEASSSQMAALPEAAAEALATLHGMSADAAATASALRVLLTTVNQSAASVTHALAAAGGVSVACAAADSAEVSSGLALVRARQCTTR